MGFEAASTWQQAIAAAKEDFTDPPRAPDKTRPQVVGAACGRLRARGWRISFNAFGPRWDDRSLSDACRGVDALVSRLGGSTVINQIGGVLEATGGLLDELWLFGEKGLGVGQTKAPALPYGWLLGLAAKHAHRPNRCRKPEIAWRTAVRDATDIAASFDCQRYSQYEQMFRIASSEIDRAVRDALCWRSLFFTPQTPALVPPCLREAFRAELTRAEDNGFATLADRLFAEIDALLPHLGATRCCLLSREQARRAFPTLLEHSRGVGGEVNKRYALPSGEHARDDTRFVLLDGPKNDLIVRPIAMTVQAFCETLFGLAWARLPKPRAEKAVGNILERAIATACAGKADVLVPNMKYEADGKKLEVDVATRTGNAITLIEVKAKPLTRAGQTGRHGAFFADYARSYLPMIEQLARHERHVMAGRTPLVASGEALDELRVEKIAVSPVSYGPITDRTLATPLHATLFGTHLEAAEDVELTKANVATFNKAIQKTQREIGLTGPIDAEGRLDVFDFFLFTHWVDLGQLIYALHRAERVDDALRPVRHATTGSRDFWSELAYLGSLTAP